MLDPQDRQLSPVRRCYLGDEYPYLPTRIEMSTVDLIIQDRLELIEGRYRLRQRVEVTAFMRSHPHLIDLLLEAAPILEAHFPDAQLFLELVSNPESAEQRLLVSAATAKPVEQALTTLHQFDTDWWLDNMDRGQGLVCIDTESR